MGNEDEAPDKGIVDIFQSLSEEFDQLCQARHEAGQQEYGQFTFLENDIVRMMAEELADTANYCRYQFIKLMLLQNELVKQLEENGQSEMGAQAFKGTKKGWNKNG
jgi:hypothetical protein